MQEKDSNVAYQYVLGSHPRGINKTHPILNSCTRPWKTVTIDMYSNCMLCICDGWLPKTVGKITDFERLEDIWKHPTALEIQQDINDKKFTWCAVEHCGIKNQNQIDRTYKLIFGIDDSCNLQCPSCRREKRMHLNGPLYDQKLHAVNHTVKLLNAFDKPIHITLASSGDPLASHIYRPLLHSYVGKSTQTFTLFTNGLLIKKQLPNTALLPRITEFRISIDAGSSEVYEKVRVGGDWQVLMENFDFIKEHVNTTVNLIFTVQKNNYRDIPKFVDLCTQYGFNGIFTQLDDWGTWNSEPVETPDAWTIANGTFKEHNVFRSTHPEYLACKAICQDVKDRKLLNIQFTPMVKSQLNLQ